VSNIKRIIIFLEDMVSGSFLVTGLGLVFYGVIMRYFLEKPVFWADEIATYFVIWGTFLGLSVALREKRHIQVVLLYDRLPLKVRWVLSLFVSVLGTIFCIFFTYAGILLEQNYLMLGQTSLNSQTPLWIPYLIVPISVILFGLRFIAQLYELLRGMGKDWMISEARRQSDVGSTSI